MEKIHRLWCDPILIYRLTHQRMPKYRNDCTCPGKNTSKFFHFTKDGPFHRVYDLQECKQHRVPAAKKTWYNKMNDVIWSQAGREWVCSSGLYSVIMTVWRSNTWEWRGSDVASTTIAYRTHLKVRFIFEPTKRSLFRIRGHLMCRFWTRFYCSWRGVSHHILIL